MEIVTFATSNLGKQASVAAAGHRFGITVVHYNPDPKLLEFQDDTYGRIAAFKAEQAAHQLRTPVFCIDGGFELDAHPGWPGVLTEPTLKRLGAEPVIWLAERANNWGARIRNALAFCDPNHEQIVVFEDTILGNLVKEPRGNIESRYRWSSLWPYFVPIGRNATFAEMDENPGLQAAWREERDQSGSIYHLFFTWIKDYHPRVQAAD